MAGRLLVALIAAGWVSAAGPSRPTRVPFEELIRACATTNPYFVTTIFNRERGPASSAVVEFKYGSGAEHLASHEQVGSVYGVATSPRDWDVYVAAYHKRGTPFGPGGPGQIYRIHAPSGTVAPFVRVLGASGPDQHDTTDGYWPDHDAVRHVGRTSLGDIDMEGSDLYAMSLADRRIYHYRLSGPALVGTYDIGSVSEPWAADARPFALKVWQNRVYHGVVNSAQSSGDSSRLTAHVYETSLFGGGAREVLQFSLSYPRQHAIANVPADWQAWRDDIPTVDVQRVHGVYPQPILADIEFSNAGDMIVGLRDRFGDMTWDNPIEGMPDQELPAATAGDVLRARREGSIWRLDPSPEFFRQDAGPGMGVDGLQDEIAVGSLARVHTEDVTVAMAMSALRLGAGGALWFRNTTGENTWREELYAQDASVRFQKANGHGDVERLCGPVPPPNPPGEIPTRVPSATSTVTATGSPTSTGTPTVTASTTSTGEPTASASATRPAPSTTPTATPTTTSTTPRTETRTATAPPTNTSTPIPTATEVQPSRFTIYLPFNWQPSACRWETRGVDVVLVLDRSTSMLRSVEPGGLPKNAAAVEAARRFVRLLRLGSDDRSDRVGVVGFNEEAWVENGLSDRLDVAEAALDRIEMRTAEGTRLDLAFGTGTAALANHRVGSLPVMIVLTDGLPNRVPTRPPTGSEEVAVLWAAGVAKAAGIRVFTVGLGEHSDIFHGLLTAAASRPGDYFFAPDALQLGAIYESIAVAVRRCP